ncbi:hypothetical protein [Methylobacterium sp. 22177]|uniref:hypothetical protein n=1 Tax=Methylobacterium sp. 22177 TaxID=3453885 RepID=UPI003F865F07
MRAHFSDRARIYRRIGSNPHRTYGDARILVGDADRYFFSHARRGWPLAWSGAMIDLVPDADRDACAREAAAAIEAVLDHRCPELKCAFWGAVEKRYRLDTEPCGRLPAEPSSSLDARPPA